MDPIRFAPLVAAFLLMSSAAVGQEASPETEYFPLKKGNTWIYSADPGGAIVQVKVAASQSLGKSTYYTLETYFGNKLVGKEDVTVNREKEGQGDKQREVLCVYRGRIGEQPVNPPLCFLRVPVQQVSDDAKPDQWTVNSKVGKDEEIKGTFIAGKADIELDKRKYQTITVTSEKMTANGQAIQFKYYFAANEGLVKQEVTIDKTKVELKLLKFEAGKQ